MISDTDIAFIAGLFDGEGCITYKQYMRKRKHNKKAYPTWSIRMELAMTDESVLRWVHEGLGVGTVGEKRYKTKIHCWLEKTMAMEMSIQRCVSCCTIVLAILTCKDGRNSKDH